MSCSKVAVGENDIIGLSRDVLTGATGSKGSKK